MKWLLLRMYDNKKSTVGFLFFRNENMELKYAFTIEDGFRQVKEYGETRIPDGEYEVKLRKHGRVYEKYLNHSNPVIRDFTLRYGVFEIMDVPGFSGVLLHIGNTDEDTRGCVLIGNMTNNNSLERGGVFKSVAAYAGFIKSVEHAVKRKTPIRLAIVDYDQKIAGSI